MATDTPPATASGNSDTLQPARQLWAVRRTHHPPLLPLLFSLLPLHPELRPSPCPSPPWRMGWCPGELEGASTGSLWTERKKTSVHLFKKKKKKDIYIAGLMDCGGDRLSWDGSELFSNRDNNVGLSVSPPFWSTLQ